MLCNEVNDNFRFEAKDQGLKIPKKFMYERDDPTQPININNSEEGLCEFIVDLLQVCQAITFYSLPTLHMLNACTYQHTHVHRLYI